jgi:hypothetical protein
MPSSGCITIGNCSEFIAFRESLRIFTCTTACEGAQYYPIKDSREHVEHAIEAVLRVLENLFEEFFDDSSGKGLTFFHRFLPFTALGNDVPKERDQGFLFTPERFIDIEGSVDKVSKKGVCCGKVVTEGIGTGRFVRLLKGFLCFLV